MPHPDNRSHSPSFVVMRFSFGDDEYSSLTTSEGMGESGSELHFSHKTLFLNDHPSDDEARYCVCALETGMR